MPPTLKSALKRAWSTTTRAAVNAVLRDCHRKLRRDVVGVFYHAVADYPLPHVEHLYSPIPTAVFREDLDFLQAEFRLVPYDALHNARLRGGALPLRAAHLSFDDGYRECFTVVRPILEERRLPATFFVTADFVGNRRFFPRNLFSLALDRLNSMPAEERAALLNRVSLPQNPEEWAKSLARLPSESLKALLAEMGVDADAWLAENKPFMDEEEIRSLHAAGFTIGAHGVAHRKLGNLTPEEAEREIIESCAYVRDLTGQEVVPFAFPHSGHGLDRGWLADVRRRNPFVGLFFDTKGMRNDAPWVVQRVWAERPQWRNAERTAPLAEIVGAACRDAVLERLHAV